MTWESIWQYLFPRSDSPPALTIAYWILLGSIAGVEVFAPQLPGLCRNRRWPANFGLGLINMALIPLVPITALWAAQWAQQRGTGALNLLGESWWPFAAFATVVILSFADYSSHWLCHKAPLLWRLHRVHHFDTEVDVSTGVRHHPVEFLLQFGIAVSLAFAFGLPPAVLMAYGTTGAMFSLLTHANIRLPAGLDRALRLVVVTPRIHAVHHSSSRPETDSNYGSVFTLWDRLFGTFSDRRADRPETIRFGQAELQDPRADDLWWQLKSPIVPAAEIYPVPNWRASQKHR
jgi:sterol desaturase/sphingolipid hydroxylase (fatty acid hydroxylase superfamily)